MTSVSQIVAAVGVDHVRLSYYYLDQGDLDEYASLLDSKAVLVLPRRGRVHGPGAVAAVRCSHQRGAHTLRAVFAVGGWVVALGRFVGVGHDGAGVDVDFADIFSLSEYGLLVEQSCFRSADHT